MPEIGSMMRALELQKLIEDKVSEWRERSARVAGGSVADSYQQPLNFKRHTNRRKNSAEINRIIAKYTRPHKKTDERYFVTENIYNNPPTRPARNKKGRSNLKVSKSEDNLSNISAMDTHPNAITKEEHSRFNLAKYSAKSYEDIAAFVDVERSKKSQNFEHNSILNAKIPTENVRPKLHSISENLLDVSEFRDSGLDIRSKTFSTSTPLSKRKTCRTSDSVSVFAFEKCAKHTKVSELRKGTSEPDILSATISSESVDERKTLDTRKRWKVLKQPFRKGAFDCLLLWRGKKRPQGSRSSSWRTTVNGPVSSAANNSPRL